VIPPALEVANRQRTTAGVPSSAMRSHGTRCATPASPRSLPRAPTRSTWRRRSESKTCDHQSHLPLRAGSAGGAARLGAAASWRCTSRRRSSQDNNVNMADHANRPS
jgi:hypothetical protein